MQNRAVQNNLYRSARFHFWALAGCFLFALLIDVVSRKRVFTAMFPLNFAMLCFQMELFAWIGMKIFSSMSYDSVPQFIRRVVFRLLLFYAAILLISIPLFFFVGYLLARQQNMPFAEFLGSFPRSEFRGVVISSSFGLLVGTLIYFFIELTSVIKRELALKEEKLRYQYETLKNQMNPHFLFNSLNTLSSIIYTDVAQADKFIGKLSLAYRYILDSQESKLVSLDREIAFVTDFFYLQQLRDGERIQLNIEIENPSQYLILPVSMQLLVENALKHNMASAEKPLVVHISMEAERFVVVQNNRQPKQQLGSGFRIGLKNLQERAKIILGKEIVVQAHPDFFTVKIPVSKL